MAQKTAQTGRLHRWSPALGLASLSASLMLGACAQTPDLLTDSTAKLASDQPAATTPGPQNELQRATVYWGQEFSKKPNDLNAALSYARNLKALGERQKALAVLQQASVTHSDDPELAGEYGRLALDLDQIKVAGKLLEVADNPAKPDWRVISARGTVLAKQGQYKEAIPFYERALTLSENQPSVLNNLALAHALSGDPKKAEELLRQAEAAGGSQGAAKVRQNLALVLGLQGKYDEAKAIAAKDLPADSVSSNNEYVRRMVRLDPKAAPAPEPQPFATTTAETARAVDAPQLKSAAVDVDAAGDGWKTNVASAARPQRAPTAALKGSTP